MRMIPLKLSTISTKKEIFDDNLARYNKVLERSNHKVKFEYVERNNNKEKKIS